MISESIKIDLVSTMPAERVFQKHVVDGKSYFFSTLLGDVDREYELRHSLAEDLGLSINEVTIVGSAKLGFSLRTHEFSAFDSKFETTRNPRDKSDIDIAIVSRSYFDSVAREVYALSRHLDSDWSKQNWQVNAFYREPSNLRSKYVDYLAKGWLRPDYLPSMYYDEAGWRKNVDAWYRRMSRKISIGIYSDWYYLKNYQVDNLERLRAKLKVLGA